MADQPKISVPVQGLLAELLEASFDSLFVWNWGSGRIERWNRGAERLYGFTEAEAVGREPYRLLSTKFPQPFPDIHRSLRETRTWAGEVVHRTRSGTSVKVVVQMYLLVGEDGSEHVLETGHDIG